MLNILKRIMWTKEFGKYFAVRKALNYREAVDVAWI